MSVWSRLVNVFHHDRLNRDIQEELEPHIAEADTEMLVILMLGAAAGLSSGIARNACSRVCCSG